MAWTIVLFETGRGEKPVASFIDLVDTSTEAKVFRVIRLLVQYGPRLMMPHTKKMSGQLYELRIRGKTEIRIFYVFKGQKIYLLHAFKKKSQKTPTKELRLAEARSQLLK